MRFPVFDTQLPQEVNYDNLVYSGIFSVVVGTNIAKP